MGAALHYSCSEGFNLVGTASQECLPTGEWSSFTPLCMQGESLGGAVSECFSTNVSVCFLCTMYSTVYACMCVCVHARVCMRACMRVCVCVRSDVFVGGRIVYEVHWTSLFNSCVG